MPRFFSDDIRGEYIYLNKDDENHIIKSLRMKNGDEIIICDTNGFDFTCEVEIIDESVKCKIIDMNKNFTEPNVDITLYQALPKGDKMDMIVQKCTELGIKKIVPVLTKRCVSRPDEKKMLKKITRYQKIAFEAAKQSQRGVIPRIENIMSLKEAVDNALKDEMTLFFYEKGGKKLNEINFNNIKSLSFFIGSEGGFSLEEVNIAKENNFKIMSLGNRILRCETAPIAALSCIMLLTDNM